MAKTIDRQELLRLARLGAVARLEVLERERAQILRAFPGIGPKADGRVGAVADASARRRRRRMRPKISAAGRAAISAAQKKRWAAIKRKAAGGS